MPGSGIGPCVRPVSDRVQTPAKGSSHIRKILPPIPSTSTAAQRLAGPGGSNEAPMEHGALQLQTNAFVIPCYINAWNCGAKCAELSCLSPVYEARGERKQEEHERPFLGRAPKFFLEFLKLLASGDGTCFFNPQNEKNWKRRKRSKRQREKEIERAN